MIFSPAALTPSLPLPPGSTHFLIRVHSRPGDAPPGEAVPGASFHLGRTAVELGLSHPAALHSHGDLHLLLKGSLPAHSPAALLDLYRRCGPAFARSLSGSFLILLVDESLGEVFVITDHSGSLKAYTAAQDGCIFVSSSLRTLMSQPALAGRALDPAGVASSLVGGHTFAGLTLFQGVSRLARASIHRLGPDCPSTLRSQEYWSSDFRPCPGLSLREGQAELAPLLVRTLERHWQAARSAPALSLSAGYDARAILGLLGGVLGVGNLTTFSYALGTPQPGSDPALSPRLAAHYGFQHEVIPSYRGDLLGSIERNALWGDGGANFCDEVDAWDTLSRAGLSDVFVGDHVFGWNNDLPSHHPDYLAEQVGLLEWRALDWLRPLLPPPVWSSLGEGWDAARAGVLARVPRGAGPQDQTDFLAMEARTQDGLMPWREHFTARAGRVRNVFLDGEVLEFVWRTLPSLRDHKRLFKRTVRALAPDLFVLPHSKALGYKPDWAAELYARREDLSEEVWASASPLDALIPPDLLPGLLAGLRPGRESRSEKLAAPLRTGLARARRSGPLSRLLGPLPTRTQVPVSAFLMRVLTLRAFLASLP